MISAPAQTFRHCKTDCGLFWMVTLGRIFSVFKTWKSLVLTTLLGVAAIAVAACGGDAEPEVITEVQTVIVEKQVPGEAVVQTVIVEKQVPGETVLQTVVVEKQVPGQPVVQTVVVEKEVPGQTVVQTVVVEKIVIQAPEPDSTAAKGHPCCGRHQRGAASLLAVSPDGAV